MRDFLLSVNRSDFINRVVDSRTQPSMNAKYGIVNNGSNRQIVKYICTISPHIEGSKLPETLIVKAVHLRYLPAFMVATNESNHIRIAHLISQKKEKGFDAVEATVNKVSHEKIVDRGDISTVFEKFQEIIKLSMNITAESDGGIDALDVALFDEDLFSFGAEYFDFVFGDGFSLSELFDLAINKTHIKILSKNFKLVYLLHNKINHDLLSSIIS